MPAVSIVNLLNKKYKTLGFEGEWHQAFSTPQANGVWFIWGNSGNGKTSFTLQLCKEVCRTIRLLYKNGRGAYLSLEESDDMTMQEAFYNAGMGTVKSKMKLIHNEGIEQLSERLSTESNLKFAVIDSFQYAGMNYAQYKTFKEKHKDKLLIFISHADGKQPAGRAAKSVMYDASLKIWVEGYKAFSKGRYIGPNGGTYTIWEQGAALYHGQS